MHNDQVGDRVGDGSSRSLGDVEAAADAFDQLPVLLVVTDGPELRTVAYNGYVRAAVQDRFVQGQPIMESFARDLGGQGFAEMYGIPTATGRTVSLTESRVQLNQPDGTVVEIFIDATFFPRLDTDGRPRGTIVMGSDVTQRVLDRRAAESELETLRGKYAEARGSVRAMQRALLADSVPAAPSYDIAARYVLAADEAVAGGDWFDAIARDDGSVVLVVGDVVGHGQAAAVAMGQLRSVLLAQLKAGAGITEALMFLDSFAADVPSAGRATVSVVLLGPDGDVEYCTAGHPPPLILAADSASVDGGASADGTRADGAVSAGGAGSRYLPPSGAGPLVTGSEFITARAHLGVGDAVVLYSDGILERPGVSFSAASLELLATAGDAQRNVLMPSGAPTSAAERIAGLTIELLTRVTGHADDITILAAQRRSPVPALVKRFGVTPDAVVHARTAVRSWLEAVGSHLDGVEALLHATTELVANVIDHAHLDPQDSTFELRAELSGKGRVTVEVIDKGTWKLPMLTRQRGRGLALVRDLVNQLEITRSEDGTTARVHHKLTRSAGIPHTSGSAGPGPGQNPELFDVWADGGPEPMVSLRGPFDGTTVGEAAPYLSLALTEAAESVTVDLTLVTLLASAGVDALFRLTDEAKVLGLTVTLTAPYGTPSQHILDLVGLPHRGNPM